MILISKGCVHLKLGYAHFGHLSINIKIKFHLVFYIPITPWINCKHWTPSQHIKHIICFNLEHACELKTQRKCRVYHISLSIKLSFYSCLIYCKTLLFVICTFNMFDMRSLVILYIYYGFKYSYIWTEMELKFVRPVLYWVIVIFLLCVDLLGRLRWTNSLQGAILSSLWEFLVWMRFEDINLTFGMPFWLPLL